MYTTSVKDAVKIATEWVKDLVPNAQSVRLEQIDTDDRGDRWEVVVSYTEKDDNPFAALTPQGGRIYKLVAVDRDGGEPIAFRAWSM